MSEINDYTVPVVWLGVVLGDATTEEFEKYFKDDLGFRVKYVEEFVMQDGVFKDTHCTVFNLHREDVGKFAIFRLGTTDMKWMDDWIDNRGLEIPLNILKKYAEKETVYELLNKEMVEL